MKKSYYGFSRDNNSTDESDKENENIKEKPVNITSGYTPKPTTYYASTKIFSTPGYRKKAKEIGKLF